MSHPNRNPPSPLHRWLLTEVRTNNLQLLAGLILSVIWFGAIGWAAHALAAGGGTP